MLKYCQIINEETGLVNIAVGTNEDYYKSIGMEKRDVEQSDIDENWYLAEKCPHKPEAQKLTEAKEAKYQEALTGAKIFIETEAAYQFDANNHIEATDGNIGKFTAYALAYVTGQLQPTNTVVWNTKEDETVELTQAQVQTILIGLGQVQAIVWTVKYPAYITAINEATTVEEVNAIEVNYES